MKTGCPDTFSRGAQDFMLITSLHPKNEIGCGGEPWPIRKQIVAQRGVSKVHREVHEGEYGGGVQRGTRRGVGRTCRGVHRGQCRGVHGGLCGEFHGVLCRGVHRGLSGGVPFQAILAVLVYYKTVLLHEQKRYTDHHLSSTPSAVLSQVGTPGRCPLVGIPPSSWPGQGVPWVGTP